MARIVVGYDGSPAAQQALEFATREARMREAVLEVVHVRPPIHLSEGSLSHGFQAEYTSAEAFGRMVESDRTQTEEAERHAREAAERLLGKAVANLDDHTLQIETTNLVDRRPARQLVELLGQRGDVDLLVVGSRGLGELSGRILGSVSLACVTHARVPVTVVHRT